MIYPILVIIFILSPASLAQSGIEIKNRENSSQLSYCNGKCDSKNRSSTLVVNKAKLASDLKAALGVKTWYYKNKNENEKLAALENSKIKSVKDAIQKRFELQKRKLHQVTDFLGQIAGLDPVVKKINDNAQKLNADSGHIDVISDINKLIYSAIDKILTEKRTINFIPDRESFVLQIFESYKPRTKPFSGEFKNITEAGGLEIGVTEVSQAQWLDVMGYNPSFFSSSDYCSGKFLKIGAVTACPDLPVENFDIMELRSFIRKLNDADPKYNYRLPSKKEWFAVAKLVVPPDDKLDMMAWHYGNAGGQSRPVGVTKPDKLGLHDVLGNMYEVVEPPKDFEIHSVPSIETFGGSWLTRRHSTIPYTYWTIGKDYTCFDVGVRLVRDKKRK